MSKYYSKNQKTRREKIGFYTAFAICLIAVCMAVYSTYTTVHSPESASGLTFTVIHTLCELSAGTCTDGASDNGSGYSPSLYLI